MKTICIITSSHGRNDIRMFQKQTITLSRNGFKVIYVVADGKEDTIGDNYLITSLGILAKGKIDRLLRLSSRLLPKVYAIKADVYQICDPELITLGVMLKNRGCCVIFDSVEDWEGYYAGMYSGITAKILSRTMTFVLKRYLNRFNLVLVMSPNIQKRLELYAPGKVRIVSNYPITEGYLNIPRVDKSDYLSNKNQLIYCGSVYDFSEQESVVRAIGATNTNTSYLIVGSIPQHRRPILEELTKTNKLRLVSWVQKNELIQLYRSSICGVVIFDYTPVCCNKEGQMGSNKIFEYMLEGLPVICTDFELWKKLIIDKYKCGICVNPKSEKEISEAITYLVENKEEAYEMGQRGRDAVLSEFNWESQAQKYINIFNELLK